MSSRGGGVAGLHYGQQKEVQVKCREASVQQWSDKWAVHETVTAALEGHIDVVTGGRHKAGWRY